MMCLRLLLATTTESQRTEITQFIPGQPLSGIPDTILSGVIIGGIAGFGYLLTSAINMFVRVRDNAYELMRFVRFDPEYKQHAQTLKALSKKLAEKKTEVKFCMMRLFKKSLRRHLGRT
jgi:hypothetical protein